MESLNNKIHFFHMYNYCAHPLYMKTCTVTSTN